MIFIYLQSFIHHLKGLFKINIMTGSQLAILLVSSIGRVLHRYRRGDGLKSRTGLNFFKPYFRYQLSNIHKC